MKAYPTYSGIREWEATLPSHARKKDYWLQVWRFRHEQESILFCERCGLEAERLYPCYHVKCYDDTPHKYDEQYCGKKIMICWDCDFEVTNGRGEPDDDAYGILMERWEDEYNADPINTDVPPWLLRLI